MAATQCSAGAWFGSVCFCDGDVRRGCLDDVRSLVLFVVFNGTKYMQWRGDFHGSLLGFICPGLYRALIGEPVLCERGRTHYGLVD